MKKLSVAFFAILVLATFLAIPAQSVQAQDPEPTPDTRLLDEPLPGEPPFPVTDRSIPYWIHNCSVSQGTIEAIDQKLEELNASRKTQTVILCMPYGSVSDGVLYAITFYNYMQLGYTDLEYRDRGFVWLVQVDASNLKINYAVGEGLPKVDAYEIDIVRNNAYVTYSDTGNLETALQGLTDEYLYLVSSQYPGVQNPSAPILGKPVQVQPVSAPIQEPSESGGIDGFVLFIILLVVFLVVLVLVGALFGWFDGSGGTYSPGRNYTHDDRDYTPAHRTSTYTPRDSYRPSPPSRPSAPPRPSTPSRPSRTGSGGGNARRGG